MGILVSLMPRISHRVPIFFSGLLLLEPEPVPSAASEYAIQFILHYF